MSQVPMPLEIRNLELWFPSGQSPALVNVNVSLKPGTVTAIIGPAGIGKSTLFKAILNEIAISSGSIKVAGEEVKNGQAVNPGHFSYVPQKTNLMGKLSVWKTVELAAYARLPEARDKAKRHQVVEDVIQKLNMNHKKDGLVKDLSGGEERRVSIALELVSAPQLLLLDEPTSGLDEGLDKELHETLRSLADDERKPAVLFVTHSTTHLNLVDPATGRTYVDQVIAIGKATDASNTATIRHIGKPNQILSDFHVTSYSEVMKILRAAPANPIPISNTKPALKFDRSYKTLNWFRSFCFNLWRQWLLIGKLPGLVKSLFLRTLVGFVVALVLLAVGRLGLGWSVDGPNQEFLTHANMLVLLLAIVGTLLPVMGIVNAWNVVRREQRWGVSARSFVWAQACFQILLIVPSVAAATILSLRLTDRPTDQTLLPQVGSFIPYWQLFFLLMLSTLASFCIGILIGSLNTSTNTANVATGVVFAVMVVGNGLIFTWPDFLPVYLASFAIPSRSGIALISSNFNAELVMGATSDVAFRMNTEQFHLLIFAVIGISVAILIFSMVAIRFPLQEISIGGRDSMAATRRLSYMGTAILLLLALSVTGMYYGLDVEGAPPRTAVATTPAPTTVAMEPSSNPSVAQEERKPQPGQVLPVFDPNYIIEPQSVAPQMAAPRTQQSSGTSFQSVPETTGSRQSVLSDPVQTPANVAPETTSGVDNTSNTSALTETTANEATDGTSEEDGLAADSVAALPEELSQPSAVGGMAESDESIANVSGSISSFELSSSSEPSTPDLGEQLTEDVAGEDSVAVAAELPEEASLASSVGGMEAPGDTSTNSAKYYDIGGDTEPDLRQFHDVIDTQPLNMSCDLGDYEDWTKRPQQASGDGSFAAIIVDVTSQKEATISFCIEEEPDTDIWSVWLGQGAPTEYGCDSLNLTKPDDVSEGLNIVTWTIPAECVHQDSLMLVFAGTNRDGAAVWGVLVEQEP